MSTTLEILSAQFPNANAVSRSEFRKFLGISASTDWRAFNSGRYPRIIKIGCHERILLVDFAAFLDAGGASTPAPKRRGRPVGSRNKATHAPE